RHAHGVVACTRAGPAAGLEPDEAQRDSRAHRPAATAAGRAHGGGAGGAARLGCGAGRRAAAARSGVMANFVLVHGAWHGGWCWRHVQEPLARAGHRVHAVTLTGVGERAHLMSPSITLETHIADVAGVIEAEELNDV